MIEDSMQVTSAVRSGVPSRYATGGEGPGPQGNPALGTTPGRADTPRQAAVRDQRTRRISHSLAANPFLKAVTAIALGAGAACLLAALLAVVIGGARTPPDLTSIVGKPPCAAPCWRQITPGVTRVSDALLQLRADPSLEDLTVNVQSASWWWTGAPSNDDGHSARTFDGRLLFASDTPESTVDGLALMTSLSLGDLLPALGSPAALTLYFPPPGSRPGMIYMADYGNLAVFAALPCPLRPADFWRAQAGVTFGAVSLDLGGSSWQAGPEVSHVLPRVIEQCGRNNP